MFLNAFLIGPIQGACLYRTSVPAILSVFTGTDRLVFCSIIDTTRQMHTASRGEPENACMQFVWSRGKRTLPSQPFLSFIVRFSVPSLPVKFSSSLQPLFMVHIF